MHATVPVRFGRGRLDSLGNKGLAAYLMRKSQFRYARAASSVVGFFRRSKKAGRSRNPEVPSAAIRAAFLDAS